MPRAGRSRPALLALALLAVTACVGSEPEVAPPTSTTAIDVAARPLIGAAVRGGRLLELRELEASVGELEMVRLFARWDSEFPDADHRVMIERGLPIHLSIRPRLEDGGVIPWADLARLEDRPDLAAEVDAWAERLAELPPGSYVTFNHEPDTSDSAANGDAADFVAAWRRVVPRWTDDTGLRSVWVLTGGRFGSTVEAERWYPGDDVVDVVGADLYNWHTCQGSDRPWRSLEQLLAAPSAFARDRGKPLAVPEFASVEDPAVPGRKAQWIDDVGRLLDGGSLDTELEFLAWFDVTAPDGNWPDCEWDLHTSPEAETAFAGLLAR